MVTILPRVPSTSEKFAKAFANLGQSLGEEIPNYLIGKKETTQQNKLLKDLGIDATGIEDRETRKILLQEAIKGKTKENLAEKNQTFLNQLFQGQQGQPGAQGEPTPSSGFDPTQLSDEVIARATAEDPNLGRALQHSKDVGLREKREGIKSIEKKEAALRTETLPIRKEISEKADLARRGIENKERLLDLIKTGNIDDPTYATLAEALPLNLGKRLLSPQTVEYKAGLIDEFGDLRKIFQGQTRIKEIELLEQKIPDLYLTDEQKETILKSRINALKSDLIREEAASELEEEGKNYGVLQFRKEVEKRAKPRLEALFNRVLDEQNAIIKDAENLRKTPLSFDDPEGHKILSQILQEAGGDRSKARKIAKQKGYTIGK